MLKVMRSSVCQGSTLDEVALVMLSTINHYYLRNNPTYCRRVIHGLELMYSDRDRNIPDEIRDRVDILRSRLKG